MQLLGGMALLEEPQQDMVLTIDPSVSIKSEILRGIMESVGMTDSLTDNLAPGSQAEEVQLGSQGRCQDFSMKFGVPKRRAAWLTLARSGGAESVSEGKIRNLLPLS